MNCKSISDLLINLSALHKLSNMLIEILDAFTNIELCDVDQGVIVPNSFLYQTI